MKNYIPPLSYTCRDNFRFLGIISSRIIHHLFGWAAVCHKKPPTIPLLIWAAAAASLLSSHESLSMKGMREWIVELYSLTIHPLTDQQSIYPTNHPTNQPNKESY